MTHPQLARREFLLGMAAAGATGCFAAGALAAEPNAEGGLKEPVYRVAKAKNEVAKGEVANPGGEHPLDPALKVARETLSLVQNTIDDYTCTMVKRERIKGVLGDHEYMQAKVRNRKLDENGKIKTPLSAYLKFVKPKNVEGREVVWVEGQNNGKLKAHEGGLLGRTLPSVSARTSSPGAAACETRSLSRARVAAGERGARSPSWRRMSSTERSSLRASLLACLTVAKEVRACSGSSWLRLRATPDCTLIKDR